jgi:hypothetical protein
LEFIFASFLLKTVHKVDEWTIGNSEWNLVQIGKITLCADLACAIFYVVLCFVYEVTQDDRRFTHMIRTIGQTYNNCASFQLFVETTARDLSWPV